MILKLLNNNLCMLFNDNLVSRLLIAKIIRFLTFTCAYSFDFPHVNYIVVLKSQSTLFFSLVF